MRTRKTTGRSPSELRRVFAENLKMLVEREPSVASAAREIGINRTQFNRYLAGASFPTPDVLHRICQRYGVDARILLEPLRPKPERPSPGKVTARAAARLFDQVGATPATEEELPSGFYRIVQHTQLEVSRVIVQLGRIWRDQDGCALMKAYIERSVFTGVRMPFIKPLPRIEAICLSVAEGVAILSGPSNAHQLGFAHILPDTFGRAGHFQGTLVIAGRGTGPWYPRRRIIFRRLSGFAEAMEQRRRWVGYRPITELPEEERSIFETY